MGGGNFARLDYIDAAKGLLILELIILHIGWAYSEVYHGANSFMHGMLTFSRYTISPYFMAAFFLIHGYCSRKVRTFEEAFVYGSRTLLIPMLLLCSYNVHWFCTAMFIAILLENLVERLKTDWMKVLTYFVIAGVGFVLQRFNREYLYIDYALVFTPFLFIGKKCRWIFESKTIGTLGILCLLLYPLLYYFYFGVKPPRITGGAFHCSIYQYPQFVVMSVLCTSGIIMIAKALQRISILRLIGKNSLVIYLFHFWVLFQLCYRLAPIVDTFNLPLTAFISVVFGFILLASSLIVASLINRFAPYVIGKKNKR